MNEVISDNAEYKEEGSSRARKMQGLSGEDRNILYLDCGSCFTGALAPKLINYIF